MTVLYESDTFSFRFMLETCVHFDFWNKNFFEFFKGFHLVRGSIRIRGVQAAGKELAWAARAGNPTCRSTCIKINFETNFQKSQTTNLYM